ncbi:hypothetical protein D3C72_1762840 [compost metagenome]
MRLAGVAKRLDHRYAIDEFDGGPVEAAQAFDEHRHVRATGLHGPAQKEKEPRKRQQGHDGKAPVLCEQIDRRRHDGAARACRRREEMRGQAVQGRHVVLQGLLDLARRPVRKPAQWHLSQTTRAGQTQVMRDPVVSQVGSQLGGRH